MRRSTIICALIVTMAGLEAPASAATDYFVESIPVYQIDIPDDQDPDTFSYTADWALTISAGEVSNAVANGWSSRGTRFYVSPAQVPGTIALNRLYNPPLSDHLYTTSYDEMQGLKAFGYFFEGVVGYVYPANANVPGTVPLQRFYAGDYRTHHEYYTGVPASNLRDEGVMCRVWPARQQVTSMAITAPRADEELKGNSNYDVSWNSSTHGGFVTMSYSTDAGNTWMLLEAGIQNTGFTTWKVPNLDTQHARVRIVWTDALFGPSNLLAEVVSPFDFKIKKRELPPGAAQQAAAAAKKLHNPTGLAAKIVSPSAIRVSWRAAAGAPTGYIVERQAGNGRFIQVANVKAPDVTYTDNYISPATKYVYRVSAYSQKAISGHSRTASVATAYSLKKPALKPGSAGKVGKAKKK